MPRMPFIGVRISWLMLARNSLLARLAASATSLAFSSSSFWRADLAVRAPRRARSRPQLRVLAFHRREVVKGGQRAAAGTVVRDDGRGVDRHVAQAAPLRLQAEDRPHLGAALADGSTRDSPPGRCSVRVPSQGNSHALCP